MVFGVRGTMDTVEAVPLEGGGDGPAGSYNLGILLLSHAAETIGASASAQAPSATRFVAQVVARPPTTAQPSSCGSVSKT